jgi:hexulose-6-phosphate isomerase
MKTSLNRRGFLKGAGATLALASLPMLGTQLFAADNPKRRLKKAIHLGMISGNQSIADKFKLAKETGFDGLEVNSPSALNIDEILKARDATGLEIASVMNSAHWSSPLSDPNPEVRARGMEGLKTALRDAKKLGCSSVLLVPAVVKKDVSYADAYTRSQAEIRKVVPLAEELGVTIAIENVWNQFLLSPLEAARYVDEFNSPRVGWHFDVGNLVNYGWPEQWIRILGKRIAKVHVKEFSRSKRDKEGLWKGFEVELLAGDCDWPAVMKALDDIGYQGWLIAEISGGDAQRLKTIAELMDRILAS